MAASVPEPDYQRGLALMTPGLFGVLYGVNRVLPWVVVGCLALTASVTIRTAGNYDPQWMQAMESKGGGGANRAPLMKVMEDLSRHDAR